MVESGFGLCYDEKNQCAMKKGAYFMSSLKKKVMALITAIVMLTASLPLNIQAVFGAETTYGDLTVTTDVSGGVSYSNNVLTISSAGEYTISGTSESDRVEVTASSGEVIIIFDNLSLTTVYTPFNIRGSADVTIKLRGENTLKADDSNNYAGLQKTNTGSKLTITSASGDGSTDGNLDTTGGDYGAGIGGGSDGSGENITIAGGRVTATGGRFAAGIGGGYSGAGSNITITGGTVTATGGISGAGIGGGYVRAGSNITITGGTVTATGGSGGAGIGGGEYRSGSNITITGGTVTATGGYHGAGIGGGSDESGENITITGGYLNITAGTYAANAIGGEYNESRGNTNITGGYFKNGDTNNDTVYGISINGIYEVTNSDNPDYPYLVQMKEEYLNNPPEQDTDGVYMISTAEELISFAVMVFTGETNINGKLMNDIDMNGITDFIPVGMVSSFDAKGNNEAGYTGTFDGQGYTISNLAIADTGYVTAGLFGNLSGTVKNVGLDNVSFEKTGSADGRYGVLCGLVLEGGTVENCYVINSSVDATTSRVAGVIAGGSYGGTVKNCYTKDCSFTAYSGRGGYIVGDNIDDGDSLAGTVENCYTDGSNITGSQSGTVTGGRKGVSDDSFARGEVCYLLNGSSSEGEWGQKLGTDAYPVISDDIVYISYNQCLAAYTNDPEKENDKIEHTIGDNGICGCGESYQEPEYDEENAVYLIKNAGNLVGFANKVNSGQTSINGKLIANVDLEDYQYMIGTSENPYRGTFNGNGYTVTVGYDSGEEYTALFRYIDGATIKNLNTSGSITTSAKFAAGIAGLNTGSAATISSCTSTVTINSTVNGDGTHGGIIANSDQVTAIENCAFTGSFEGSSTTCWGGIAGWLNNSGAKVSNSYVALKNCGGSTASSSTIARGKGSVDNCYYLTAIGTAQGTQKSAEAFARGEVAYLLNNGITDGTQVWYQNIGSDRYPVFEGETVYYDDSNDKYYNHISGDADMSGTVDKADAALVLKYAGGIAELTEVQKELGNVNGGDLDITDAVAILKMCEQ